MANRVASFLLLELREMLVPTIFFFVSFNMLVLTVALLSSEHTLSVISHVSATIGALLVGKAFLLADKLPMMDRYVGRPLIYGALWSAFLYFLMTTVLHLAERLISVMTGSQGFLYTAKTDVAAIDWTVFLIIQLWLALLLTLFSTFKAVSGEIGTAQLREMFLTRPAQAKGTPDKK